MRIDSTMNQKEETYQVILDIIKNSACYNAFLVTADASEIYMQQFWFSVKKVKKSSFYEFDLDDKKCIVYVELFKKILDICSRVQGEEFMVPPSEKELLTFLIELGYKGQLNHLASISFSSKEKVFLGVLVKGGKARLGAKSSALRKKCGELWELMQLHLMTFTGSAAHLQRVLAAS
ncbi:hypothetical protein Tco_0780730 [Tanacetum coccineum]